MSRIPRFPPSAQESVRARALRLAAQLTPMQRHLVVRAGLPAWLQLPAPFQPAPGRPAAAARALSSAEYGLLEPIPLCLGAYRLTALGELVAGIWLGAVVCDGAPHRRAPGQ